MLFLNSEVQSIFIPFLLIYSISLDYMQISKTEIRNTALHT